MKKPDTPDNEVTRLQVLQALQILDTPPEERFDRLTRIAQQVLQVPIVLISLIDADRQWFKSRQGLDATETPRDISFCGHVILGSEIFYVPDATRDVRFSDNPLVTDAPGIRFYAGAPLELEEGHRIGTLCVIDMQPRQLSNEQLLMLRDLARCVTDELQLRSALVAAHKLMNQEKHLHVILDTVIDAIITIDAKGSILSFNKAAERIFEYATAEVIGQNVKLLMPEPYHSQHDSYLSSFINTGQAKVIGIGREVVGLRKSGETFPMELAVTETRLDGGHLFIGIMRDISKRKAAEKALVEITALRSVILNTVLDGIITVDSKGSMLSFNKAAERIFGYTEEVMIGRNVRMLLPVHRHAQSAASILSGVIGLGREVEGLRKSGQTFPMEVDVVEAKLDGKQIFTCIVRDVTKRQEAEREMMLFRRLVEYTDDPVYILNPRENYRLVYTNPAGFRHFGYAPDQLYSMHASDWNMHYSQEEIDQLWLQLRQGDSVVFEAEHKVASGKIVPVEISANYLKHGDEEYWAGHFRNITERRRMDRMKSEFISTVSHELRTPLTSIRGSLGLISGTMAETLPVQARKLIDIAYNNSERLVRLINDILDIEKIESGRMQFNMQRHGLQGMLAQSIEANQGYAEQYGVRFELRDQSISDVQVLVDADRFMQVMANLLSNAAKFSPEKGLVEIEASKIPGDFIRIGVIDHGPGIPVAFRDRIFQKFSQADSSDTRVKGGTGLGLSIVKAIVEHMGGQLGFDTEVGRGTTMHFTLPMLRDSREDPSVPVDNVTATGSRILVCEDERVSATMMSICLQQAGYIVDLAGSAEEAKRMLRRNSYSAMTLDIMLPGQDGPSFVRELRDENAVNLPIIIVSSRVDEEHRQELAQDIMGWVGKPVQKEQLLSVLQEVIRPQEQLLHILHLEDDDDVRAIVSLILQGRAIVRAASTVAQAESLLDHLAFDLVIVDIGLSDGPGLKLLAYLEEHGIKTPVMIFSADEIDEEIFRQVAAVLVKSRTSNQQLVDTIYRIVSRTRKIGDFQ